MPSRAWTGTETLALAKRWIGTNSAFSAVKLKPSVLRLLCCYFFALPTPLERVSLLTERLDPELLKEAEERQQCARQIPPHCTTTICLPRFKKKKLYLAQTLQLLQVRVCSGCLVGKVIIRLKSVTVQIRAKTLEASTTPRRASAVSCSTLTGKLRLREQQPRPHPCSSQVILTDALENPLGLVLPPDPEEVNRDPTEDDCKANGAFLRRHPEGNSNEEQAGQDEENGQADAHLRKEPKTRSEVLSGK